MTTQPHLKISAQPKKANKKLSKAHIQLMFERLLSLRPNPQTELVFRNEFELLISVILSAQATDVAVNKATKQLFIDAPTPADLWALGEQGLIPYIQTIGLYRNKARHVIQTCQNLVERFDGKVPATRQSLESLPGVGRKTANVVMNTAFGAELIAVDTHVFRVSNRTGLAIGKTVDQVEEQLMKRVPKQFMRDAHHSLILHGRYVCQARAPKCGGCSINDFCPQN
jgi:endonuclease-3